jgi:hypothetical protein
MKKCLICENKVEGSGYKYCSTSCKEKGQELKKQKALAKKSNSLDGTEGIDYITCKWCNYKVKRIYGTHIKNHHTDKTIKDYHTEFPDSPVTCTTDKQSTSKNSGKHMKDEKYRTLMSKKFKGVNNPNHKSKTSEEYRKTLSPFSKSFKGYEHVEDKEKAVSEFAKRALANRVTETNFEYWLKKTGSLDEAEKLHKERQRTFTLDRCIEKHGEFIGKEVWKKRQLKWHKSYKKLNYSKISQKLFIDLYESIKKDFKDTDIFFATLKKDEFAKNHEAILLLNNILIRPDFYIDSIKKIIEFDGVYYHRKNPENKKREEKRDQEILQSDYQVLHICESEYKSNPIKTIEKCINFIYDKKDT